MLGHIFYFIGLFLFFFSFSKSLSYTKFIDTKNWINKFKKVTGKDPLKTDFRTEKEHKNFVSFGCLSIFEMIWFIIGLLSNNWIIFGFIILIGMILHQVNKFLPTTFQKIIGTSFSLFRTGLILILVLNHFHFHNDLISCIFTWL